MDWSCTSIQAKPAQLFTVRYVIFSCQGNDVWRLIQLRCSLSLSSVPINKVDRVTVYCELRRDVVRYTPVWTGLADLSTYRQGLLTFKAEPGCLSFFWLKLSRLSSPFTGRVEITQHQRRMDMIPHRHRSPQNNLWKTASLATLARPAHDARAIRAHERVRSTSGGLYPQGCGKRGGMGG